MQINERTCHTCTHTHMDTHTRARAHPPSHIHDACRLDSWSLSHLGYIYPGTTPVMIKLDHNRSCPWVYIAQVTKAPTIIDMHTDGLSHLHKHSWFVVCICQYVWYASTYSQTRTQVHIDAHGHKGMQRQYAHRHANARAHIRDLQGFKGSKCEGWSVRSGLFAAGSAHSSVT